MNRDHLLGYAPAALVSADCPDDYDDMEIFDYHRFPLGEPRRVAAARRDRLDVIGRKKQPQRDFENIPQPNPDGSYTPKYPGRLFRSNVTESFTTPGELNHITAKQLERAMEALWRQCAPNVGLAGLGGAIWDTQNIKSDGPVVQESKWTFRQGTPSVFDATKHAENPLTLQPWNRPAIPLSALVPRELMRIDASGEMHTTWLADGNHFFVNGREVSREEFERAFDPNTPRDDVALAASIRDVFNRCKPGSAAQQLLGRQLESLEARAQAVVDRVKTPMRNDLLAQALKKANEDPAIRERWTKRVQMINADLKKEAQSKGDGGIALPEINAAQAFPLQTYSMPIVVHTYGPEFDFPPNA